ncbi:hypothetical protein [Actinophytocola algeriensis]|uniref:Uncharacterized protein n=1 Tax=Actinophytocola algeriensis TaxID=1768010 RepID=A0A7W7Q3H7_9PSEU|nr:hypothetical protein [Actinophytocola algeriensis]MBB4906153.1 hypothetical protein [Actinophytocola algeriensis]MBE1472162.1 hypothetical protein [Actinophytocola algeriensis]
MTVAFAGCGATGSWGCGRGFGNHVVVRHDRHLFAARRFGRPSGHHTTDRGVDSGQLSVKEGGLSAGWQPVANGSSFAMSPNRIAIYDGQLRIKDGPPNAPWNHVSDAGAFDLA